MHDPVNHPSHYTQNGTIECIEAIEASMSHEEFKGFLKGNAIKYVWRYANKNGAEDLKKARWYLDRLISIRETEETKASEIKKATEEVMSAIHNPGGLMVNDCSDGFCPMPSVRQGPSEPMFTPVN